MNQRTGLVLTVVLLGSSVPAFASSGSGSGGSGGSSGSGGSGSDSTASGGTSRPAPCREISRIVGLSRCSRFGGWRAGRDVFVELGPILRVGAPLLDSENSARVTEPMVTLRDEMVMYRLRLGFGLRGPWYMAFDHEVGVTLSRAPETSPGLGFAAFLIGGARLDLRYVNASAELAAGLRGAGAHRVGGHDEYAAVPELEARARVERWLTPWIGLGMQGSASVIENGAWSTSLYVMFHNEAFGGLR